MPAIGGHAVHFLVYKLVFLPGDSSAVVPLLPIPNRIVKGSSGDDTHLARDWDNTSSPGFFVEKILQGIDNTSLFRCNEYMGTMLLVFTTASLVLSMVLSYWNADTTTRTYAQQYNCERTISDIFTDPASTLQLGTFRCPTTTPSPTPIPTVTPTRTPTPTGFVPTITPTGTIIAAGGPTVPPSSCDSVYSPETCICIDDEDADECDDPPLDPSSRLVPRGSGGVAGAASCNTTVVEQALNITDSLPRFSGYKGIRDSLNPSVSSCGYSTGTYPPGVYLSTYLVIDAYNLAGHHELSKTNPSHVDASAMFTWWQSPEAQAAGYRFIPYSTSVIQQYGTGSLNLTGCVMFLNVSSGKHVGIVNNIGRNQFDQPGNDYLAILQSNASHWVDRFVVYQWDIKNTVLHIGNNAINGVVGFGCRQQ